MAHPIGDGGCFEPIVPIGNASLGTAITIELRDYRTTRLSIPIYIMRVGFADACGGDLDEFGFFLQFADVVRAAVT